MRYDERKEAEAFERGLNIGRLDAAKDLASAEERGRRRGVEEADKLRVILLHVRRWMRADSPSWVKVEADTALGPLKDLAPRSSAPAEMDASGGPRCWCGKTSRHESGWCGGLACQGGAPRDSAPDSVTPSALPRDEGKDAIGLSQDELDDIEADAYVRGMGDRE